jgi:vitamin K-dependent gamma-carboxylase
MTEGTRGLRTWLARTLWAPRDIASLVVFRIALGSVVAVSALRFLLYGWVDVLFVRPKLHLSYWGFEWVPHLSGPAIHGAFIGCAVLGMFVAVGLFYRASVVLLWALFAVLQLQDVSNYLNHYYLVSLLLALMAFIPAHRAFSLDVWRRPGLKRSTLPGWCLALLRFQVGTVYFFAGLAKLNADWLLHAQPLRLWLAARTDLPWVGPYLSYPWVAYLAAWSGFLFDTTVTGFLLVRRTRAFAYAAVLVFHAATSALFPIGMFPVIMTLAASVFFEADWPRRWFSSSSTSSLSTTPGPATGTVDWPVLDAKLRAGLALAVVYLVLQVALPLRANLYGGNVSWHEQGMRFSWRVMTREKNGSLTYRVRDPLTGREWHVPPRTYLTSLQERELAVQPDLILQLAKVIAQDFAARGKPGVQVFADARVSLNGRPAALLVLPTVDLARLDDGVSPKAWIAPGPVVAGR